jgi:hypothetical protein
MNFSPQAKAWIMLVTLALGTGSSITVASHAGGADLWISILCGVGTAASNIYHALSESPKDKQPTNTDQP